MGCGSSTPLNEENINNESKKVSNPNSNKQNSDKQKKSQIGLSENANSEKNKKKTKTDDLILAKEKRIKELQIEEAKQKQKDEEERKKREAEEERKRKEAEEEIRRIKELEQDEEIKLAKIREIEEQEELRRIQIAEEEERRLKAEEEARKKRLAEEEKLKKEAEEARKKKEAEEEARKIKEAEEEEEARKKKEEEEAEESRKKKEEDEQKEEEDEQEEDNNDGENEKDSSFKNILPFALNRVDVIRVKNRGEVISIGLGGLGYKSLLEFYDTISTEHNLYSDGLNDIEFNQIENLNIYFSENRKGDYKARGIIVDSGDKASKNYQEFIKHELGKSLFYSDNFVYSEEKTKNNYSQALKNTELIDFSLDTLRKEIEKCDSLLGIQFFYNASGGAGSAYSSKFLESMRCENPSLNLVSHAIISDPPTGEDAKSKMIALNTVMCIAKAFQESDIVNLFGYETLKEIGKKDDEMSKIIGKTAADLTCLTRFSSGNSNEFSLRTMLYSLVPFPRIHFVVPSLLSTISDKMKPSQIIKELYEKKNLGPSCIKNINNKESTFYISTYQLFRGNLNKFQINQSLQEYSQNLRVSSVSTFAFPTDFLNIPATDTKSCVKLANHSCINETFKLYCEWISNLVENGTDFLRQNGFNNDIMEFTEINSNLSDLVSEYECYGQTTDENNNNQEN